MNKNEINSITNSIEFSENSLNPSLNLKFRKIIEYEFV